MRYIAAIVALLALASCRTLPNGGTVVGFVTDPPSQPPQPYGFAEVHLGILAIGALMAVAGIVLALVFSQVKMGSSLALAGMATLALGWAAGYYGEAVALAAAIMLGIGVVGALGLILWYAFKDKSKKDAFKEIVKKANGQIDGLDLSEKARATVERVKKSIKEDRK